MTRVSLRKSLVTDSRKLMAANTTFLNTDHEEAVTVLGLMQTLNEVRNQAWKAELPICHVTDARREAIKKSDDPRLAHLKAPCENATTFIGTFQDPVYNLHSLPTAREFR